MTPPPSHAPPRRPHRLATATTRAPRGLRGPLLRPLLLLLGLLPLPLLLPAPSVAQPLDAFLRDLTTTQSDRYSVQGGAASSHAST
jgi:hypothetical protein